VRDLAHPNILAWHPYGANYSTGCRQGTFSDNSHKNTRFPCLSTFTFSFFPFIPCFRSFDECVSLQYVLFVYIIL